MENVKTEIVKQIQSEGKKLLVDFYTTWCGPCRSLIPLLEKIEKEYSDVTFVKVNVEENLELASELGITSVPTVVFYNGTTLVDKSMGVKPETYYKDILNKL
jgi:thioredoxin 1